jgi:hypothetical protein
MWVQARVGKSLMIGNVGVAMTYGDDAAETASAKHMIVKS